MRVPNRSAIRTAMVASVAETMGEETTNRMTEMRALLRGKSRRRIMMKAEDSTRSSTKWALGYGTVSHAFQTRSQLDDRACTTRKTLSSSLLRDHCGIERVRCVFWVPSGV